MQKLADVIRYTVQYYHKIFIFAVLERWLIYVCETECSFVSLIFAVLLHKFSHAIFEIYSFNRFRDRQGSQNFKSRSRDPFATPLTQFCILFVSAPSVIYKRAKFEVSSFNRFRDMEGVPIF